jgi:hypothetical protein
MVTGTQQAIIIWNSTLRNITIDGATITNALAYAVRYESDGATGIVLSNITSTGSGYAGFYSPGHQPPGVTPNISLTRGELVNRPVPVSAWLKWLQVRFESARRPAVLLGGGVARLARYAKPAAYRSRATPACDRQDVQEQGGGEQGHECRRMITAFGPQPLQDERPMDPGHQADGPKLPGS